MWSCIYNEPSIIFLTISALGGTLIPNAFSTALIEAIAWVVVHTPQVLCTKAQTSFGFLPFTIFSKPRTIVDERNASLMVPSVISTSALK